MNQQREVIYKKRRHALHGDRLSLDIANMIYDTCEYIVSTLKEKNDFNHYKVELIRLLSIESPINDIEFKEESIESITENKTKRYS